MRALELAVPHYVRATACSNIKCYGMGMKTVRFVAVAGVLLLACGTPTGPDVHIALDRTDSTAESWGKFALIPLALLATVMGARLAYRRSDGSPGIGASLSYESADPIERARSDRVTRSLPIAYAGRLAETAEVRRALLLGATPAFILTMLVGAVTALSFAGEWALIAGAIHLLVFGAIFFSHAIRGPDSSITVIRATVGLGASAGLFLGWVASWYVLPVF